MQPNSMFRVLRADQKERILRVVSAMQLLPGFAIVLLKMAGV
jgi:hypothetical protein